MKGDEKKRVSGHDMLHRATWIRSLHSEIGDILQACELRSISRQRREEARRQGIGK